MGQTPSTRRPVFPAAPIDEDNLSQDLTTKAEHPRTVPDQPIPELDDFIFTNFLGKGEFGVVLEAKNNLTDDRYAVKILERVSIFELWHRQDRRVQHRERNLQIVTDFNFLLKMFWHYQRESFMFFVIELAPYGTLYDVIPMAYEHELQFVMAQLVLALEYLHKNDIVHRDIRLENIFVGEDGYIRLGDFGIAKRVKNSRTHTLCGTYSHMAPEMMENRGRGYGTSVDWYTVGVCLYELVFGMNPSRLRWETVDPRLIKEFVTRGYMYKFNPFDAPSRLRERGALFILGLLEVNPERRLGIIQSGVQTVKNQIWLGNYNYASLYAKRYKSQLIVNARRLPAVKDWRYKLAPKLRRLFPRRRPVSERLSEREALY